MRLPDWSNNLMLYLNGLQIATERGEFGFDWDPSVPSALNCLTFGSGGVKAVLGKDIYQEMAASKQYDSAASAYRVMRGMGYKGLDQLIGSLFKEKPPIRATYGDLVLIPVDTAEVAELKGLDCALAIAEPPIYWYVTRTGLARGSMSDVLKAYDVS